MGMKEFWSELIRNRNKGRIQLSHMEMTTPYYPESRLAHSKFHGFYTLFYVFTIYFSLVFPALNYLRTGSFFQNAYLALLETNLFWDMVSIVIFISMSLVLMSISNLTKAIARNLSKRQASAIFIALISTLWVMYVGTGFYIVRAFPLSVTDRIFVVVASWGYFIKTISYIFDMHEIVDINAKLEVQRKHDKKLQRKLSKEQMAELKFVRKSSSMLEDQLSTNIQTKLIFLISPESVFKTFVMSHDPTLHIHKIYLFNKALTSLICSLVNLVILLEMVFPLCNQQYVRSHEIIEIVFRLIPPIFYMNLLTYYMVLENIIPALAEVTQLQRRVYYLDWWNSTTFYDFLDRWCLLINSFTETYLTILWNHRRARAAIHVAVIMVLIFEIFSLSKEMFSFLPMIVLTCVVVLVTFVFGSMDQIQNNYVVLLAIFAFTPLMVGLDIKYKVLSGSSSEVLVGPQIPTNEML